MLNIYPRIKWFIKTLIYYLFKLYVAYVAYSCNSHEMFLLKYGIPLLAFYFAPYYISYYILYHKILKIPCAASLGSSGVMI